MDSVSAKRMASLRQRWRARKHAAKSHLPSKGRETEHTHLRATVPGLFGSTPLLRIEVDVETRQDSDGETVRVTAQLDGHIHRPAGHALAAPDATAATGRGLRLAAQRSAHAAVERVARVPAVRRALHRAAGHVRSQLIVEASTRPLARGAQALIPAGLAHVGFGRTDATTSEYPVVEAWEGTAGEHGRGTSHVGVLQLAKRHLPPSLAEVLGDKPFHLTAVIAQQIEPDDD